MGVVLSAKACACECEGQGDSNTMNISPQESALDGNVRVDTDDPSMNLKQMNNTSILSFKVSLSKQPSESYGLAHMPHPEDGSQSLLICDLRPDGPIAKWNMEQRSLGKLEYQVLRGDRIVAVGDVSDTDGMRERLRSDAKVEFTVERWPDTITVFLKKEKEGDKFGMQTELIVRDDGTKMLRVGRVSAGLLGEWNARAAKSKRFCDFVCQLSAIVKVNQVTDNPEKMQQLLVSDSEVEISFSRPDPELYNH